MTHRGGRRQGSGRPRGSSNLRTRELAEAAAASGLLPHEFLLAVVRGERIPLPAEGDGVFHIPTFAERLEAARVAAPYYAPRLAAVECRGANGSIAVVSKEQRDAAVRAALRAGT